LISFAQNTELDRLGLTMSLTLGRAQVRGMVDLYNVLNGGTVLGSNGRYGTAWLTPTAILAGRTLKFGGQFEF
jgi:hypothetical protein